MSGGRGAPGALDAHVVVDRGGFRLDARLHAAPGEPVAVMGPSGAGKSTLVAALAGLVPLSAGGVRIGDRVLDDAARRRAYVPPMRRGIVLLGQDPRLFPHLSARENIAFALRAHGADRADARTTADEWLARVGLPDAGGRRPAELSGGQQQRVALARALAAKPQAILLDEPLTALDAETADGIRTVIADQLAEHRPAAVIVTHDAVDAAALAARLLILENGAVTQDAPVREVLTHPASRFAAAVAGVNRVVGRADAGGWRHPDADVLLVAADAASASAAAGTGRALAAVFAPAAVRLEPLPDVAAAPGAPGEWIARIARLEPTPGGVRVHTAEPSVMCDLPASAIADLGLVHGTPVRLRVAASDVRLQPA